MKKTFHSYMAVWAIGLAIFNLTAFLVPHHYNGNFFAGYIFITLAFIGQLFCAHLTFRSDNPQKLFYNIPLTTIGIGGTLMMILFGALTMAIPKFPVWLGIILCFAVLGFTAIAVISTNEAVQQVDRIDQTIKADTIFIKMLAADAESLMAQASPAQQPMAKKVWEALRYSDPVSNPMLSSAEAQINVKFSEFRNAVTSGDEQAKKLAEELLFLIEDRNRKCKILK